MSVNGNSGLVKDSMYVMEWRDHFSTEGWFDKDTPEIDSDFTLRTVGFFVSEDEHYFHFARTVGEHAYADMMSILKEQIVEIYSIDEE